MTQEQGQQPPGWGVAFVWPGAPAVPVAAFAVPVDDVTPGWVSVLTFTSRDGVVELSGVELTYVAETVPDLDRWLLERNETHPFPTAAPPRGLTTRQLRSIRWGDLQKEARGMIAGALGQLGPTPWAGETGAAVPHDRREPDRGYAALAVAYERLVAEGVGDPVATLAANAGLSRPTVRNRLSEARRRKLLTSAGQGRAGGVATDKARRLVDGER